MINEGQTYSEINIEEEIENILTYLRDNGEFSGDAPRLVIIDNDVENARLFDGKTAFYAMGGDDKSITLYVNSLHETN